MRYSSRGQNITAFERSWQRCVATHGAANRSNGVLPPPTAATTCSNDDELHLQRHGLVCVIFARPLDGCGVRECDKRDFQNFCRGSGLGDGTNSRHSSCFASRQARSQRHEQHHERLLVSAANLISQNVTAQQGTPTSAGLQHHDYHLQSFGSIPRRSRDFAE